MKANILSILIMLCSLGVSVQAQTEKTKTIDESFTMGANPNISIHHRYGALRVKQSMGNTARIEALLTVTGSDKSSINTVLEKIEIGINHNGNQLSVKTNSAIKNWNTIMGRTRITFKDGTKVSGIKKIKIELIAVVPADSDLELENKYDDIILEEDVKNVRINLYDGKIEGQNITGKSNLNLKYSSGELGDLGETNIILYDSKLTVGNTGDLTGNYKYSTLKFGNAQSADLESYDSNIYGKTVQGNVTINDKYSQLEFQNIKGKANIQLYDATLKAQNVSEFQLHSKYSEIHTKDVDNFEVSYTYDDQFVGKSANLLTISESKYSKYHFENISQTFTIQSYDDQIEIGSLGSNLKKVSISGKYTKFLGPIGTNSPYLLEANMTYGHIYYPEAKAKVSRHIEKNSKIEISAMLNQATSSSPKVNVTCYDCTIKLQSQ